jgi:subtilisin-like proprotein convertase family protein
MKNQILLTGLMLLGLAGAATATIVTDSTWSVGQAVPDNSAAGLTVSQTLTGLDTSAIDQVEVRLNLSGGYNGDLYGYLVLQSADGSSSTAVLLNRIGQTLGTPYGNSGSTLDVTLGDTSGLQANGGLGDVHNVAATGNVTGTYTPDGNAAALDVFNGHVANGTWTLFLADLSAGDASTLVSWGVTVSVVPEPITWALVIFGGGLVTLAALRGWRRRAAL